MLKVSQLFDKEFCVFDKLTFATRLKGCVYDVGRKITVQSIDYLLAWLLYCESLPNCTSI